MLTMEEIPSDGERNRSSHDLEGEVLSRQLDEPQDINLLDKKKEKPLEQFNAVSHKIFIWAMVAILISGLIVGMVTLIVKIVPQEHGDAHPKVFMFEMTAGSRHLNDKKLTYDYTLALHKALMFFNAQKSGKLPKDNNVSWRGDSCTKDGLPDTIFKDLSGGYYDAGDPIKFNFPEAFTITMLSWSVIEYSAKYEAAGELAHVKDIIKWGTDYFLKTFNHTSDSIETLIYQVGSSGYPHSEYSDNDHSCWMRPEDIDYPRPVMQCGGCSDLASEMAAALASASIVFKDDRAYSQKLVHGAKTLYKFGRTRRGRYSAGDSEAAVFYNSSGYYDEYLWGGAWLYYATGNISYLRLITHPAMAKHAGAFENDPDYGILSWDNKLIGAQVLLTRLRLFTSPGFPYEDMLKTFYNQTRLVMCSYLPDFNSFNRTKGGLIQLNYGRPLNLQFVVNAAFLASLFSDYLDAADTPGFFCEQNFFPNNVLRHFAKTQMDYILGNNPKQISYVVGFGNHYPQYVHHRGASIPNNKVHYSCRGGSKWKYSKKPNPNVIVGAMVGGPDKNDGFHDDRVNYNYTETTIAANSGLVAALVALSGEKSMGIDLNTLFSAIPSMFTPRPKDGNRRQRAKPQSPEEFLDSLFD